MNKKHFIISIAILLLTAGAAFRYIYLQHTLPVSDRQISVIASSRDQLIERKLKSMSLRDKVALLFIFHIAGTDSDRINHFLTTYKPGGLILMGDNIPATNAELLVMTKSIRGDLDFPPLLAIDQEGGTVNRISSDDYAAGVGLANGPVSRTSEAFTMRSNLLASAGIPLNFGIVADVTNDPSSFIYPRVLGTTPESASERVGAAVLASKGKVYSTLKHFPGHGEPAGDSHETIPTTDIPIDQWRIQDKPPFAAGIDAGAEFVMMGHLRYSAVDSEPASLSAKWHGILRSELEFEGIVMTDDMFMLRKEPGYDNLQYDAVRALGAAATMVLFVTDNGENTAGIDPSALIDHVVSEVSAGNLSENIIDTNARKVLEAQYNG